MKVYILTYDTVYSYSNGEKYSGIEGVYLSRTRAEKDMAELVALQEKWKINDTHYDITEHQVEE